MAADGVGPGQGGAYGCPSPGLTLSAVAIFVCTELTSVFLSCSTMCVLSDMC